jgi:hypothetical protein
MADANSLLFGSAAAAMSFDTKGTEVRFRLVTHTAQHRREVKYDATADKYVQGDLLYWNDGKVTTTKSAQPALDPVLTVQTTFRKWEGVSNAERAFGEDDGLRRIFIRGRKAPGSLMDAVKDACKAAGIRKIDSDQFGSIKYVSDGKKANKNMTAPKVYEAVWYPADKPPTWASELPADTSADDNAPEEDDNPFE